VKCEILLAKMTWEDVEKRLKESDVAIVPVGSTEQHGPALPLDNDAFTSYTLAVTAAEKVADYVKPIVTPAMSFGVSDHHMEFPGTITLPPQVFTNVIVNVCKSLIHHGFRKIVLLNGHGGNDAALHTAIYELKKDSDAFVCLVNWWNLVMDVIRENTKPPFLHADETETSIALALNQLVKKDKLVRTIPVSEIPEFIKHDFLASPPTVEVPIKMKELSKTGVVGDATRASKEKGEKIVEATITRLTAFLRALKDLEKS
jgi:creatinine amidohydrolase